MFESIALAILAGAIFYFFYGEKNVFERCFE